MAVTLSVWDVSMHFPANSPRVVRWRKEHAGWLWHPVQMGDVARDKRWKHRDNLEMEQWGQRA